MPQIFKKTISTPTLGGSMSKTIEEFIEDQSKKEVDGRITLTKEDIIELQNRVKHYLNAYETENKMNASEVAKILGYTGMHYSRFKLVGTFNKVASVFLFLSNFSKLKDMSLSEFMIYIENKPLKTSTEQLSRGLFEWEIETIEFMNKMESTIRRFFTRRAVYESNKNETIKNRLEISMTLATLITYLDLNDLKLLISIIKDFSKRAQFQMQTDENESVSVELKSLKKDIVKFMKDKFKDTDSD